MFGTWWAQSAYELGGPALVVAWVLWIIISITFHELAHGWAAIGRGDRTPIDSGHMTFNPVVHMGLTSLVMLALLGIAFGAMPIDPSRMKGRYAEAWVAFAGPLMNFGIAVLCVLAGGVAVALMSQDEIERFVRAPMGVLKGSSELAPKVAIFLGIGAMLNVSLGLFNLLPLPPLDGSRIVGSFSRAYRDFTETEGGRVLSLIAFLLAFFFAGSFIVPVGMEVTTLGMGFVAVLLKSAGVGP